MDHVGLDAMPTQPARQPEPVAAGFEGHGNALDLPARPGRLVPPAVQQLQQQSLIGRLPLQRLARQSRHKPGDQPALETHLDHCNQRAILLEDDEGSAQIVPSHGALHRLFRNNDGTPSLVVAPIGSLPASGARAR
jgi:hypothetical protein